MMDFNREGPPHPPPAAKCVCVDRTSADSVEGGLSACMRLTVSTSPMDNLARSGKNDMLHRNTTYLVLIVLTVTGGIAVIGLLGMWLMHATMMGGMMSGGLIGCRGIMGCVGWWLVGLHVIAGVVAAVIFLMRLKPRL